MPPPLKPPSPPKPPLATCRSRGLFANILGGGCCDSQMLEEWLLEAMQLRSQLRAGQMDSLDPLVPSSPNVCVRVACISGGDAVGGFI